MVRIAEALLVVDMQRGFLREGNLSSPECLAILPAVLREVDQALAEGNQVIFTADTHDPDDLEFKVFPVHCVRGTAEARLDPELEGYLERDDTHLVAKRRYSALFDSQLPGLLRRYDIDCVRLCGVCTDICVLHTTASLRNRDLKVAVVADATATFDAPEHPAEAIKEQALAHIGGILGAQVLR